MHNTDTDTALSFLSAPTPEGREAGEPRPLSPSTVFAASGTAREPRETVGVSIRASNRTRLFEAAAGLGIPVSRLVDLLIEGLAIIADDGRVQVVSR